MSVAVIQASYDAKPVSRGDDFRAMIHASYDAHEPWYCVFLVQVLARKRQLYFSFLFRYISTRKFVFCQVSPLLFFCRRFLLDVLTPWVPTEKEGVSVQRFAVSTTFFFWVKFPKGSRLKRANFTTKSRRFSEKPARGHVVSHVPLWNGLLV